MVKLRIAGASLLLLLCCLALTSTSAWATSMLARNVVDLIDLSERILVGEVARLSDGFENGVPYTEVTISVEETIRGDAGSRFTFRQFGLLSPREMPNGVTYLGVSPDGWPRFRANEKVVVFLYKAGDLTGLQTTVGLMQGKFNITDGRATNAVNNQGLFDQVGIAPGAMSSDYEVMLQSKGAVDAERFITFVRNAVSQDWIGQGRIYHENR